VEDKRLAIGDVDPRIATCKRKLGVSPVDECFTDALAQRVRGLQMVHGLVPNGLIDDRVFSILGVVSE